MTVFLGVVEWDAGLEGCVLDTSWASRGGGGGAARETWLLFSLSLFSGELQVSEKGYSAGRD